MFQASQVRLAQTAGRYGDARIRYQIKKARSNFVARHWFTRPGSVRWCAHSRHCPPHIPEAPTAAFSRSRRKGAPAARVANVRVSETALHEGSWFRIEAW